MRVLIVDDSVVFRSQIRAALDGRSDLEVVGTANNGKIALQKLAQSSVDLVTLDMEMPEMGGIETIKEIRRLKFPVRIIVLSSHTTRGSEMALDALSCGADDFLAKPSGSDMNFANAADRIREQLLPKVLQFSSSPEAAIRAPTETVGTKAPPAAKWSARDLTTFLPSAIVIASSTGGPPALEKTLRSLKGPLRCPIFIVQHMPPVFTSALAKRLKDVTGIEAREAEHGEVVERNRIYVAPGDYHMGIAKSGNESVINLDQGAQRNSVRPAADILFETAASVFGPKVMGVVLTGMGEDGLVGSIAVKKAGGGIAIQEKSSCVVFGMPGAVFAAECFDAVGSPEDIGAHLRRMTA